MQNTERAMRALLEQVRNIEASGKDVGGLWMCRINSGKFGVKWGRTADVLKKVEVKEGEKEEVQVWAIEDD